MNIDKCVLLRGIALKRQYLMLVMCSLIVVPYGSTAKNVEAKNSFSVTENNISSLQTANVCERIDSANKEIPYKDYPEDYLRMKAVQDIDDSEPSVYATGDNANGGFRIVYYRDYDTFEMELDGEWYVVQTVYKSNAYSTSEAIAVDSKKEDIINAYRKYGIEEHNLSQLTQFGLHTFDIILKGENLADTFLYVDNHRIFEETYSGIDYWGGLGAYIFILDNHDVVVKIVSCAPTSD